MKVDIVMWAKNGSKTLPYVLHRIERVIPQKNINKRIFVDDHSTDNSVEIAKKFGWETYENKEGGIASGANTALKQVTTEFFVSVEQDVLLAKDWWKKIPKYMEDPKVAVAQGVRLPTHPFLRIMVEADKLSYRTFSLDNNIWRTKIIERLGGFPTKCQLSVDRVFFPIVWTKGYKWLIDCSVISDHIKSSLRAQIKSGHKRLALAKSRQILDDISMLRVVRIFFTSPFRALQISIKRKHPAFMYLYPYTRLETIRGKVIRKNSLLSLNYYENKDYQKFLEKLMKQACV